MPILCKAGHQNISTDTAGISGSPGWVTLNEVSGSSHHMPLSGHITSTVVLVVTISTNTSLVLVTLLYNFPLFIACRTFCN